MNTNIKVLLPKKYSEDALLKKTAAHWKKNLPVWWHDLCETQCLDAELQEAVEETRDLMKDLMKEGMPHWEAWEDARHDRIYLPGDLETDDNEAELIDLWIECMTLKNVMQQALDGAPEEELQELLDGRSVVYSFDEK